MSDKSGAARSAGSRKRRAFVLGATLMLGCLGPAASAAGHARPSLFIDLDPSFPWDVGAHRARRSVGTDARRPPIAFDLGEPSRQPQRAASRLASLAGRFMGLEDIGHIGRLRVRVELDLR